MRFWQPTNCLCISSCLEVFFLDGIATAAEQLAGRAIGAHYRPAFDRMVKLTLVWGLWLGASLVHPDVAVGAFDY